MPYTYRREPLTLDEASRLERSCKTFNEKVVIWTLLDTGLRIQELIALTPSNIDWQGHQFIIQGKGSRHTNGKPKRRVVPMTPRVRQLMEGWFAAQDKLPFGKRAAQLMVKRVANRARITRPCSPHVLRHTFSVICLKKGLSFPALQIILGHSDISTTFIYSRTQPESALEEFKSKW